MNVYDCDIQIVGIILTCAFKVTPKQDRKFDF